MNIGNLHMYDVLAIRGQLRRTLRKASISDGVLITGSTAMYTNIYHPSVPLTMSVNQLLINKSKQDIVINKAAIQQDAWNIDHRQQADFASAAFLSSVAMFIVDVTTIVLSDVELNYIVIYGLRIQECIVNVNMINSSVTHTVADSIWTGN